MICPICEKENEENTNDKKQFKNAKQGVMFTGIGYPIIFILFNLFLVLCLNLHWITLLIATIFMIGASIITFTSGYYFLVIPIPMIYPIRIGFKDEKMSKVKKNLYSILNWSCYLIPFFLNLLINAIISIF